MVDVNSNNLRTNPAAARPLALSIRTRWILISLSPSFPVFLHWIFFTVSVFLCGTRKQYLTILEINPSCTSSNTITTYLEVLHGLYISSSEVAICSWGDGPASEANPFFNHPLSSKVMKRILILSSMVLMENTMSSLKVLHGFLTVIKYIQTIFTIG